MARQKSQPFAVAGFDQFSPVGDLIFHHYGRSSVSDRKSQGDSDIVGCFNRADLTFALVVGSIHPDGETVFGQLEG